MKTKNYIKNGLYTLELTAEDSIDEDFLRKFFYLDTEPTVQIHNDPAYRRPSLTITKRE